MQVRKNQNVAYSEYKNFIEIKLILGEILIDDEVQSLALRNLWKTLCIDSIKLSDLEFIEVEVHIKKKVIQETKSSLIQRIENNVNNVTTPQSLIQRIENNVNNLNTPQRPNQNNKYPNHTPQQQIVGTVKNMQLQVIYFCFASNLYFLYLESVTKEYYWLL